MAAALGGLGLCALPGTAVAGPSAVAPAAAAAAPAGWKLVASDDFTGSAPGSVWGEYGGTYGVGDNAWSADEVSVSDGTLRVKMEHKSSQGKPYTSGGIGMWGLAQTYGRYEFQAMAPTVAGIDSYMVLWPPDGDDSDATLVELLAKPATPPQQQAAYITINYGGDKSEKTVPGSYCGAYHNYVVEWTPGYESVSVDGNVLLKSPKSTSMKRWIGFVTSNGDTLTGTPSASALPAEFDIRHLRVYSYSPGAPGSTEPAPTSAASSHASSASATSKSPTASGKPTATTSKPTVASPSSADAAALPPSVTPTGSAPSSAPASSSPSSTSLAAEGAASTSHGGSNTGLILLAVGLVGVAALGGVFFLSKRPRGARRIR